MSQRWTKLFRQLNRVPEVGRCAQATSQWWPLASAYAGFRPLPYPYRVRLKSGAEVVISDFFDLATFWPIFFASAYPVESGDRVIIDAGANVGMFTLYAAQQAPSARILSVEPFPSTFTRLQQMVTANRLGGVTCLNAALGKEAGEALMPGDDMGSQFRAVVTHADGRSGIPVKVVSLAEALDSQGFDRVDLLKMDIEGGEYPTLLFAEPAVLRRLKRICLEYHPAPDTDSTIERVTALLERCGFKRTLQRDDGAGYGMAHFVNNQ